LLLHLSLADASSSGIAAGTAGRMSGVAVRFDRCQKSSGKQESI
jgi:hypothetical protein